mmetsp:Transcript_65832/g.73452  ORF Transcript_65832/g.73452 Transcript_65832/m.73452 type:complete len:183 (+) Transcript_65832:462-1010(+)
MDRRKNVIAVQPKIQHIFGLQRTDEDGVSGRHGFHPLGCIGAGGEKGGHESLIVIARIPPVGVISLLLFAVESLDLGELVDHRIKQGAVGCDDHGARVPFYIVFCLDGNGSLVVEPVTNVLSNQNIAVQSYDLVVFREIEKEELVEYALPQASLVDLVDNDIVVDGYDLVNQTLIAPLHESL